MAKNKTKKDTKKYTAKDSKFNAEEANPNNKFIRGAGILLIGILLLVLSFATMDVFYSNNDSTKFYKDYGSTTDIKEENLYVTSTKEQILDLLDHKTGVIYFGFPTCPWCQNMVSVLNDVAAKNKAEKIYYYNIKNDRDELSLNENNEVVTDNNGTAFYRELLKQLDGFTEEYTLEDKEGKSVETGKQRIYAPLVVFVQEGEVKFAHEATVKSHKDPKKKLTEEQIKELSGIYQKGFDSIKTKK